MIIYIPASIILHHYDLFSSIIIPNIYIYKLKREIWRLALVCMHAQRASSRVFVS